MPEQPPNRARIITAAIVAFVLLLLIGLAIVLYTLVHEPKTRQVVVSQEQLAETKNNDNARSNRQWISLKPGGPGETTSDPQWPALTLKVLNSSGQPIRNARLWLLQDSQQFPNVEKGSR